MPVKVINTEFGHSIPPEEPHNITFYIPGWETARALRKGDPAVLSRLASIYPRFGPWCEVRQLSSLLHKRLALPSTHGTLLFANPDVFPAVKAYAASPWRKPEHRIPPQDIHFRVVDIPLLGSPSSSSSNNEDDDDVHNTGNPPTVRLYLVTHPLGPSAPGAVGVWQNYGVGISTRLAAALLPAVEAAEEEDSGVSPLGYHATAADYDDLGLLTDPAAPRYLPTGPAHAQLRARIAALADPAGTAGVREGDVFLYQTGMAAIYRLHRALMAVRGGGGGGTVAVLGSVFHNTHHVFEESEGGMKHFGRCDGASGVVEELARWLEGEKREGRRVGYVFVEFPSNPILVSVDLKGVREVTKKYGVPFVVDDTIASFCNVDILPYADAIVTSITKSFSGYANVMGGSVLIPPSSPFSAALKQTLASQHHNELFHADAAKLLSNSRDYLARSAVLNRNALALATFLHEQALLPTSPVTAVLYPPFTDTHDNYLAVMRPATEAFAPGYGCLLAVDFESLATAQAFYDNLSVYHGPHLGAHHTLAFPFNDAIWGPEPGAPEYLASYGARAEQVRVSVGLESEEELVDTFREALRFAEEVKRRAEVIN